MLRKFNKRRGGGSTEAGHPGRWKESGTGCWRAWAYVEDAGWDSQVGGLGGDWRAWAFLDCALGGAKKEGRRGHEIERPSTEAGDRGGKEADSRRKDQKEMQTTENEEAKKKKMRMIWSKMTSSRSGFTCWYLRTSSMPSNTMKFTTMLLDRALDSPPPDDINEGAQKVLEDWKANIKKLLDGNPPHTSPTSQINRRLLHLRRE